MRSIGSHVGCDVADGVDLDGDSFDLSVGGADHEQVFVVVLVGWRGVVEAAGDTTCDASSTPRRRI
jgi:hypothetical protein